MAEYRPKQKIYAARWEGWNLGEMQDLLESVVEVDSDGPQVYTDYVEPYFKNWDGTTQQGYYMLKFYAGDDIEVDPGQWVVVYSDGEVEIMDNEQFGRMFEEV